MKKSEYLINKVNEQSNKVTQQLLSMKNRISAKADPMLTMEFLETLQVLSSLMGDLQKSANYNNKMMEKYFTSKGLNMSKELGSIDEQVDEKTGKPEVFETRTGYDIPRDAHNCNACDKVEDCLLKAIKTEQPKENPLKAAAPKVEAEVKQLIDALGLSDMIKVQVEYKEE